MNLPWPTSKKIKAFRAIVHGPLGLDEQGKERFLLQVTAELFPGKPARSHFTDLTDWEAGQVLDRLNRKLSGSPRRQSPDPAPLTPHISAVRLVTQHQLWQIQGLREQLGWPAYRWEGLVRQACGRARIRTSAEASKVLEAAKASLARQRRAQGA